MNQSEIHIIDNRTPESRDTIIGAAKWLDRIAQRYDQLPMSFTDSIPRR